jgi:hypothetical protein
MLILSFIALAAAAAWALLAPSPQGAAGNPGGSAECCHQAPNRASMLQAK